MKRERERESVCVEWERNGYHWGKKSVAIAKRKEQVPNILPREFLIKCNIFFNKNF